MKKLQLTGWPFLTAGFALVTTFTAQGLEYSTLEHMTDAARTGRYQVFRDFKIKGICGTTRLDLAAAYGANTLRTYTPPSREQLDQYQRLGFKVIAGIWMPHQGENDQKGGGKWDFDYRRQGDQQLKEFEETLNRIGHHPAILMWCLGNEVPLDPAYLEIVNRMSLAVHRRFPKQLTSLTMVNAPKEKIALVKQYAPDLDVIGFNSYGQGAVGSACLHLEEDWGRAYYVSEFGPQGPWWGRKTAWGKVYEEPYDAKLDDLRQSFQKIDAAPHCLGSTMFLWGCWTQQAPTYFSAFLSPQGNAGKFTESDLYPTPITEEFCRYWSGKYPQDRAPILTKINVTGIAGTSDLTVQAGESFKVTATALNPVTPNAKLQYRWWILDQAGKAVVGPINSDAPSALLPAPETPGTNYTVMAYAISWDKRASGFTVPIKVESSPASSPPLKKNNASETSSLHPADLLEIKIPEPGAVAKVIHD